MKTGKEILDEYNSQPHTLDGFITLESTIDAALKEQDKITRNACAEAVIGCGDSQHAHDICMNVKAV